MLLTADEAFQRFRAIRRATSSADFFNRSREEYKKAQELWCAGRFARGYEKHIARCLIDVEERNVQRDEDFALVVGSKRLPFQLTEVQQPGRRRGLEYRATRSDAVREDWEEGTQHGPQWIKQCIEHKAEKHYAGASSLNLLVYVNFPAWDQNFYAIQKLCEPATAGFASVWLLSGGSLCSLRSHSDVGRLEPWGTVEEEEET